MVVRGAQTLCRLDRAARAVVTAMKRVAIYVLALSQILQACTPRTMPTSDHFDGSRYHNRETIAGYSFWDEIKIAWELKTKKNNWPVHFETQPYQGACGSGASWSEGALGRPLDHTHPDSAAEHHHRSDPVWFDRCQERSGSRP